MASPRSAAQRRRWARLALALAALLAAAPRAGALEPRFDHRDQQGLSAAPELWFQSSTVGTRRASSELAPRLRLAWSRDLGGEGNELVVGATARLAGWSDPERRRYRAGLDVRYRGLLGSEELKTFYDVGLWGEASSRLALGPLAGLGVAYDPTRAWGLQLGLTFATGFGEARVAALGISLGAQLRF